MVINKRNQLYKPERILYYIEASDSDIEASCNGVVCDKIKKYADSFGAYDYPGVFFIHPLGKKVIGIEFRRGDARIAYPDDLDSLVLESSFFYAVEFEKENEITEQYIQVYIQKTKQTLLFDDDAHRQYSDLTIKPEPNVTAVFEHAKKIRILYECALKKNHAKDVIANNLDELDKGMLYRKAFFDPITNYYNWNHLVPYLEIPESAGIKDYAFAHFDIKMFRVLNEIYGHIVANKVLTNVVNAIKAADFIYAGGRCHEDNFAIVLKDMPQEETAEKLEIFFEGISHLEEDPNYKIHYRCGVVPMQFAIHSGNRVADEAKMAQALGNSPDKTDIVFYTEKMHDDVLWSNTIKAYVDTAVEKDEFFVNLQPKVDIATEKLKGAEALVRWNYKGKEFLSPARFIPFFEKDGSIGKIDDIVLKKVCAAFAKWKGEGKKLYPISVNLSRNRLYDKNIITHLTDIVDSFGVSHSLIDFELTESATYNDMEQMIRVLEELRSLGFKISMDDFGTGYSSLSLLTQMPLDTLKIDKSFVDKVGTELENEKDLAVIRHIISLARELNFTCLVEGAEQKQQVEKLRALGCEVIQGYYYCKPISIEEYENRYLRNRR